MVIGENWELIPERIEATEKKLLKASGLFDPEAFRTSPPMFDGSYLQILTAKLGRSPGAMKSISIKVVCPSLRSPTDEECAAAMELAGFDAKYYCERSGRLTGARIFAQSCSSKVRLKA